MKNKELLQKPVCKRIVTKFLKMLEGKSFQERQKSISIVVNTKNFPEIFEPSYLDEEKEMQELLEMCEAKGFIEIRYKDRWKGIPIYQRKASIVFNASSEDECRKILDLHIDNKKERWMDTVNNSSLDDKIKYVLINSKPIVVQNKTSQEIVARIEDFQAISKDGILVRQASAWMFWGISKVLDNRYEIIDALKLKHAPIQFNIHLATYDAQKVLFIENVQTFEHLKSNVEISNEYTLIYMSGYKGTAKRTRTLGGSSLYFSDISALESKNAKEFMEWFYGETKMKRVYLWTDFDYEGIHIYNSLKKIFPEVSLWKPAYMKMAEAVKSNGHTLKEAKKGEQMKPKQTGDAYIDNIIIPAMEEHGFFDQEGILL